MFQSMVLTRRATLAGLAACALAPARALSQALPQVTVHRDPSCSCCGNWAARLKTAGFLVELIEEQNMAAIKERFGVPGALAACHTGETSGYVLEGHIPPEAIKRLLKERPEASGLAAPGMPVGSPGMEVEGTMPETFEVILFGPSGQRVYASYRGDVQII